MGGQKINVQNKIIYGVGVLPTVPTPSTITPDDSRWVDDTDILIGQWAYNIDDNKWFYRGKNNVIYDFTEGTYDDTEIRQLIEDAKETGSDYLPKEFLGSINFSTNNDYGQVILSAPQTIIADLTGAKIGKASIMRLVPQQNAVPIMGINNVGNGEIEIAAPINTQYELAFDYLGGVPVYKIIQSSIIDLPDLVPMTLSGQSFTSVTQIAATWNFTTSKAGTIYYLVQLASEAEPIKATILANGLTKETLGASEIVNITSLSHLNDYKVWYYTENLSLTQSGILGSAFSTIDLVPMAAPTVTLTAIDANTLRPSVNANVNGVLLYIDSVSGGTKPLYETMVANDLTANDITGLNPESMRYAQAIALGNGITTSNSVLSSEVSGTTSQLPQLATPVVTAVANGQNQIDTSVVNIANNNGYNIYGSDTQNGSYTLLNVNVQNDTTYSETGLTSGQTRWYKWNAIANPLIHRDSELSVATYAETAIPTVDYVSRLQATNDLNSEIYYSVESSSALSAYIRMKNGYGVRHKYLKDGNGFWVNSTYELGKINSNKNYQSETGTWSKSDNGNYYTSQIGATITCTFTGTAISLRHRAENSNSGMSFVVDGDTAHPAYAYATGATGDRTTVLFTGLTDTTHTIVGTFVGGGSRFFVKYNTGLSGFDTETFIITGSVNNWNPGAYQLKYVSNIEIAYTQKKFGAAYAETFFPYHTAVTSANTTTAFTVDGNVLSVASVIPFTQCNEIVMHQVANVFNNSAPAEITGVCDMLYTINRTGLKVDFSINFPQKVSIEKGYPFMHVVLPANMSKLHYNDNGGVLLSSLDQSGVNTILGSDNYRSYMFESAANGVGCAMTFNNTNALRLDKSDRVTPLCWIQKTAVDKWKLYPQAFLNSTIEANTTYTGSATYYIGII